MCIVEVVKSGTNLYVKELLRKTGLTNAMLAQEIKELGIASELFVFDSAEQKSITELRYADISAYPAIKGAGSIMYGIQKVKQFGLFIYKKSVHLQNEFAGYTYKLDSNSDFMRDASGRRIPNDKDNHGIDAIRYAVTRFVE